MSEQAKALGSLWQRWFDAVWSDAKTDAIDDLVTADVQFHPSPGAEAIDASAFKAFHAQVLTRFDVRAHVHDPIAMGEWISVRTALVLTEKASGEETRVAGLQRARLRDGKFAEVWDSWDWLPTLAARETVAPDAVTVFLTGPS